ncbi:MULTISPECIES: extracellular solute-binding protein [Rhizobium/Agrobacterium group]|uniref:ABC transporter substrate binding protein (Spermidine/putrescine) n=2 Tax=Rhizobium/Agrobacterium group TaxID=227290 RepID=B9K3Y4_ALLAM|nr:MULTISPECIES: extracellular solute-binding protein [Rhizobium/Agrobacterium group]ACM39639.1 ABC transporter substrate binding protein (spermidine/putrescine) [Allorhizobium ampelinum S4]ASK49674.1 spermidine/putrescine ABC transporter substrate-binding protein [Agrobacterium vitis]MCF1436717.1 extracellular solute-binding protein [Allorhizobium ampelinum]MCF1450305.1 extracellular solute-binding protein [Allorhizobium ampelinum]MCF1495988.1 extracellular solute-binding protein [Allorhizobi
MAFALPKYLAAIAAVLSVSSPCLADVNIIGYQSVFADNYRKAVIEPFEKKTGIKVIYNEINLSAQNLGRIRAEKNNPTLDLSIMDAMVSRAGNTEGIFDQVDLTKLSNGQNLFDEAYINKGFGPGITFDYPVLMYSNSLANPPKALADLAKPELKGQVAMWPAPEIAALMNTILLTRAAGGDEKKSVDQGVEKFAEIAKNVQTWAPAPDAYELVSNGTVKAGAGWNARAQFFAKDPKSNMSVVIPTEGSMFQINTLNLVKGAPNKEEALKFIDYALSPEAQAAFANLMFYSPTNKDAKPSQDALSKTASTPEIREKLKPLDWAFFVSKRESWLQEWRRKVITAN